MGAKACLFLKTHCFYKEKDKKIGISAILTLTQGYPPI
jgi:hypothetical protein